MKMYYGPKILITNTRTVTKQQEDTMCQKLETYEMPPVILADKTASELEVEDWYKKHRIIKLITQVKEHPELQYFPAPPCIMLAEEGEE